MEQKKFYLLNNHLPMTTFDVDLNRETKGILFDNYYLPMTTFDVDLNWETKEILFYK